MRTSTAKKYPVTNEEHTIEIKNNLQGNNRRFDEAENQINDLEHKGTTTTTTTTKIRTTGRKKNPPK